MTSVAEQPVQRRICAYCGSVGQERLGFCGVCGLPVCEQCGNVQHIRGETKPIHDACLRSGEGSGFSMIKFVE